MKMLKKYLSFILYPDECFLFLILLPLVSKRRAFSVAVKSR